MIPSTKDNLLIIVPAMNERGAIGTIVTGLRDTVPQADILVIDDGSHDNTAQLARDAGAMVAQMPFNVGIGAATSAGYLYACRLGYDLVVRVDGDGQHDLSCIENVLAPIISGEADMVVGSRFLEGGTGGTASVFRNAGVRYFSFLISRLTGNYLTDTTSGFRGTNKVAARILAQHQPSDYPEVESLLLLHRAGLRVCEVPVTIHARMSGRSSIDWFQSFYYAVKVSLAVLMEWLRPASMCERR